MVIYILIRQNIFVHNYTNKQESTIDKKIKSIKEDVIGKMEDKYKKEITTKIIKPIRLYNIFYLINVPKTHKLITQQRIFRELIRKWRFISFAKKCS